uniref:Uncharacterized protein n=1 Tax=Leersia perrieri TaxID=77586 RepID=A0A0D9WE86_9ORYZ
MDLKGEGLSVFRFLTALPACDDGSGGPGLGRCGSETCTAVSSAWNVFRTVIASSSPRRHHRRYRVVFIVSAGDRFSMPPPCFLLPNTPPRVSTSRGVGLLRRRHWVLPRALHGLAGGRGPGAYRRPSSSPETLPSNTLRLF